MTDYQIIVGSATVAVMMLCLWLKHQQRLLARSKLHNSDEWIGKAMDVTPLKPAIEIVRRDYLAAVRHPAKDVFLHKRLIELARQTVAQLAYFHHAESPEHAPPQGR